MNYAKLTRIPPFNTLYLINFLAHTQSRVTNVNVTDLSEGVILSGDQPEDVALTIGAGANIHRIDGNSTTLLMRASAEGCTRTVTSLINLGTDINAQANDGKNALIYALENSQTRVAQILLKAGANTTSTDQYYKSPLGLASEKGLTEIVMALVQNGINPYAQDAGCMTPLMRASANGHVDTVNALLMAKSKYRSRLELVYRIIYGGTNVNAMNQYGDTALTLAAKSGHLDTVKQLVLYGALINTQDKVGWTALMYATQYGSVSLVQTLIENGANVHVTGSDGTTALMIASEYGNVAIIKRLIKEGATVNTRRHDNITALMIASEYGNIAVIRLLVQKGANVNTKAGNKTALTFAAKSGHLDIVKQLVLYGALIDTQDKVWTVMEWASQVGHSETVAALIEKGFLQNIDTQYRRWNGMGELPETIASIHMLSKKNICLDISKARDPKIFTILYHYQSQANGDSSDILSHAVHALTQKDTHGLCKQQIALIQSALLDRDKPLFVSIPPNFPLTMRLLNLPIPHLSAIIMRYAFPLPMTKRFEFTLKNRLDIMVTCVFKNWSMDSIQYFYYNVIHLIHAVTHKPLYLGIRALRTTFEYLYGMDTGIDLSRHAYAYSSQLKSQHAQATTSCIFKNTDIYSHSRTAKIYSSSD